MTQSTVELKVFSLNDANTCLPLVKAIVRDIVQMANAILECRERLDFLRDGREDLCSGMYNEELDHMEVSLEGDSVELKGYIEELQALGVEVRSLIEGQIEFPSMIGGQLVYLCWKHGENQVDSYRLLNESFELRKPVSYMLSKARAID
jgi:hypothetical protein